MRKPEWLRIKKSGIYDSNIATERLIRDFNLHTVCESAQCPNKGECYGKRTATFMILGDICTRNCTFCAVDNSISDIKEPDPQEPRNIAQAVRELKLDYIVITMVTRDDLTDGGAGHLTNVIQSIRSIYSQDARIEVLISDMRGSLKDIEKILDCNPVVFNHNMETIARLYSRIRPEANYQMSLNILKHSKQYAPHIPAKSGFTR